ncbi:MAG: hypothetical protein JXA33_29665 [Anaerolineae bacterium]|nr:hypothetical protein [Anaerolineae bacterium]
MFADDYRLVIFERLRCLDIEGVNAMSAFLARGPGYKSLTNNLMLYRPVPARRGARTGNAASLAQM